MNKTAYVVIGLLMVVIMAAFYIYHHIKKELTESLKKKKIDLKKPLGIDVWCKKKPNIALYLKELFPETHFFEWNFISEKHQNIDINNPKHSIYSIGDYSKEKALYPYELRLDNLSRRDWDYLPIYKLCKHIAKTENNRCIIFFGKREGLSYYPELLFDKDKVYEIKSEVFDNDKMDVQIIKEVSNAYD